VTLLTAHKILIGSAIALFVLYAFYELRGWTAGDSSAIVRAIVSAGGAGGLAVYLRSVFRRGSI
jgi:hypothetical protein